MTQFPLTAKIGFGFAAAVMMAATALTATPAKADKVA